MISGSARALPIAPAVGCQVREGGTSVNAAVLRPDLTTVWFERDSATLTDAGARSLQAAVQSYEPGTVMRFQVKGVERPTKPSDHVAIDRVGVDGPRIVALAKIGQKSYEILEVRVVQRVGLAEVPAGIELVEPDAYLAPV